MNWFSRRGREASTYGGLGMIVAGIGQMFDIGEATGAAEAVNLAGQAMTGGAPWWHGLALALGGTLLSIKSDGDKGF